MTRKSIAVARLVASRQRLRLALAADAERGTLSAMLQGVVQRHPLLCALAALLSGALAARARPWRWMLKPELWAALLPTLMSTLATAPISTWAGIVTTLLRQAMPSAAPAASAASTSAPAAAASEAGAASPPH